MYTHIHCQDIENVSAYRDSLHGEVASGRRECRVIPQAKRATQPPIKVSAMDFNCPNSFFVMLFVGRDTPLAFPTKTLGENGVFLQRGRRVGR